MNNRFPSKETVERLRKQYPEGSRVELVSMNDPYTTLRPGDRGTVSGVDDIGTLFIKWDNGSGLGVAYGEDQVRIVENEIRYETGADFWEDTVKKHGLSEASVICGNYLQTQLSTESKPEKQFCKELFFAFYEDTAGNFHADQVVYPYDYARASDRLEASFYHESRKRNTECAQAIDNAIHASCYKANYYNLDIAAMRVLQEYGFQRVNAALACNIYNRLYDGRFSAGNKDWSADILMDQASFKQANLSAHPILLDGFTNRVRELYTELDAQSFQLAGREVTGERNSGYDIQQIVQFENNRGFVLAHNPDAPSPYVTWQFTAQAGKREYYWGNYFSNEKDAREHYQLRTAVYIISENVREAENYLAAAEMSTEQNYNMIDSLRNNIATEKADLTDGQSHAELEELAPEALPDAKPSVLEKLHSAKSTPQKQSGIEKNKGKPERSRAGGELER